MTNDFIRSQTQTQNVFNEATFRYIYIYIYYIYIYIFIFLSGQSIAPNVASFLLGHVVRYLFMFT